MALPVIRSSPAERARSNGPEELEIRLLLEGIYQQSGYDFRDYAFPELRTCIRRRMREEGVDSVSRYQHRILRERSCLDRLVGEFAPAGKDLFSPPGFWLHLRRRILPVLRTYPSARLWVAGCASGEDAYSLAILLQEEGLGPRSVIYATELDEARLDRARLGRLEPDRLAASRRNYRRAGGRRPLAALPLPDAPGAGCILFASHSLATDASFNEFNLILCRDLLPRFAPPLQARVLDLLHQSLGLFGFLALGARDSLRAWRHAAAYERLSSRHGIYRRIR